MDPIPASQADRFVADLAAVLRGAPIERAAIAVSGGPDSLALLRLMHCVLPQKTIAATVDHRLRPQGAAEAAHVAAICARLSIPHRTLTVDAPISGSIQSAARTARYALLADWCRREGAGWLITAHHLDDQAETLMMRLARGSGVGGLAGMRPSRPLAPRIMLIRPLLGWSREELARIAAPLAPVDDPSNLDSRYDRARMRRWLAGQEWLDPSRLVASAAALADADAAIEWMVNRLAPDRIGREPVTLDPAHLPVEVVRRLFVRSLDSVEPGIAPRGAAIGRALALLEGGRKAMIGGVIVAPGPIWRFSVAPPRRNSR